MKRRTHVVGFRLTPAERRLVEAHRRKGELLSECVRRLLLKAASNEVTPVSAKR